ncbi:MAG: hypothetical protein H6563_14545 [Lewinellaceae bacterium]|nr:hypothetical protein [Lewinellaceae bacterium]
MCKFTLSDAGYRMRILLWGLIPLTLFAACEEDTPETLSWEERSFVDSLFKEEVIKLRPELDSLCDLRFDSLVQFYKDSLWTDRIQEVTQQLERIEKIK